MVIWRYFRLMALLDSLQNTPENMNHCIIASTNVQHFWRHWHRSFNRWLVAYIYIPLGGNGKTNSSSKWSTIHQLFNILVVFSFVSVWHDQTIHLLTWGFSLSVAIAPEIIIEYLFHGNSTTTTNTNTRTGMTNSITPTTTTNSITNTILQYFRLMKSRKLRFYKRLRAMGTSITLLGLITANIIGFALGLNGTIELFQIILQQRPYEIIVILVILYSAAYITYMIRDTTHEEEEEDDNYKKKDT